MTRTRAIFQPDPSRKSHYDTRYETYLDLAETMRGFWGRLQHKENEQ